MSLPSTTDELIEACVKYIEDKDCSYLAKEGYIVYFASSTGRKSDYVWHKLKVSEVLRIIRAMRLTANMARKLDEHHLISAFQELGKVYEYGVKSRHVTVPEVFNYSAHSEMSLGDQAMSMLVEVLLVNGITAVLIKDVSAIFHGIDSKLILKLSTTDIRELLYKHFEIAGFVIKTGSRRPLIDGKKQPAIMMPNTKPSEVSNITPDAQAKIIAKIYGELV